MGWRGGVRVSRPQGRGVDAGAPLAGGAVYRVLRRETRRAQRVRESARSSRPCLWPGKRGRPEAYEASTKLGSYSDTLSSGDNSPRALCANRGEAPMHACANRRRRPRPAARRVCAEDRRFARGGDPLGQRRPRCAGIGGGSSRGRACRGASVERSEQRRVALGARRLSRGAVLGAVLRWSSQATEPQEHAAPWRTGEDHKLPRRGLGARVARQPPQRTRAGAARGPAGRHGSDVQHQGRARGRPSEGGLWTARQPRDDGRPVIPVEASSVEVKRL